MHKYSAMESEVNWNLQEIKIGASQHERHILMLLPSIKDNVFVYTSLSSTNIEDCCSFNIPLLPREEGI